MLLDFAMIASVVIGYFVSIALITTSFYKSRANNYLSLSLFLISSLTFLEMPNIEYNIVFDLLGQIRLDFLFGVTLFTYFLIQIKHEFLNSRWYKWIYLPFVVSIVLEAFLFFFEFYGSTFDVIIFFGKELVSICFNVYLVFLGRSLIKNSKTVSKDKKHWLLRLNLFVICIMMFWVLSRIELYVFNSIYSIYATWILLSFFSWWVLYYGVFKLQIIAQKEEIRQKLVSKGNSNNKTNKKINSATTSKVITQLYQLMEEEELYKDPLLSRLDLANRLETSEGYLSQIINQEINKSVVQFVNEYRIESAKKLLHDSVFNKYSIEAIGMESGFKSKSAFYNAFNISLGMSPGAYRKLQKTS